MIGVPRCERIGWEQTGTRKVQYDNGRTFGGIFLAKVKYFPNIDDCRILKKKNILVKCFWLEID